MKLLGGDHQVNLDPQHENLRATMRHSCKLETCASGRHDVIIVLRVL